MIPEPMLTGFAVGRRKDLELGPGLPSPVRADTFPVQPCAPAFLSLDRHTLGDSRSGRGWPRHQH